MTIRLEVIDPHGHSAEEMRPVLTFLAQAAGILEEAAAALAPTPAPQSAAPAAPAPTSAPSAPAIVPPAPTPSANPSPEVAGLDKNGLPWDARIHSSGKTQLQDGTWRKKGGVDAATVAAVEAELRAALGAAPATAAPAPAPAPAPTPAAPIPTPPPVAPAPTPTPPPVAPAPAPTPAAPAAPDVSSVYQKMTDLQSRDLLDENRMAWFLSQLGIENPVQLATLAPAKPELVTKALELLGQLEA